METYQISVRKRHLDAGKDYMDPCGCPLYHAVKEIFPNSKISVMLQYLYLDGEVFFFKTNWGRTVNDLLQSTKTEKTVYIVEIYSNKPKMENTMKTIAVVYTNEKSLSDAKLRQAKKYSFITAADVKVGDSIQSPVYDSRMLVVRVIDTAFKYYNKVTGDLSTQWTSTLQEDIKELVIREEQNDVVYGTIIKE